MSLVNELINDFTGDVTSSSEYNSEIPRLLWLEICSLTQGDTILVVNILALWCQDG